jgi:hypothetical protein
VLLARDYIVQERDKILPQQVILVEKGRLEVISNGKCTRTLERGDIIGKRWLLEAGMNPSRSDAFLPETKHLFVHTLVVLLFPGYRTPSKLSIFGSSTREIFSY